MRILSSILIGLVSLSAVAAAEPDVAQIVSKANRAAYYAGDDGVAEARMRIVDAQGNKQMRQFTILRKDKADEGDQDMMVFFSRPNDVKGTVFRVAKKVDSDDDRWLYLPALDLVKRISAGDKRTSFVGSHFYYEDVSGRNPKEDNYTLLSSEGDFYKLKAVPKDPSSVEFDHYIAEIDKKTFLPTKVTYFDHKGQQMRQMTVLKTEDVQGITTVTWSKIENLVDHSYTEMQFRNVRYNVGLPQDVFSERSLRKPPSEWVN